MGTPATPPPVRFFASVIYRNEGQVPGVEAKLIALLGNVETKTVSAPFIYTTYYEKEMGKGLLRSFLLFQRLVGREMLPSVKLRTNDIETVFSDRNQRSVNIDPGYVSLEQVVLATTKGYSHRLYLGQGIFGDLTLTFGKGTFTALPWTYPDYGSSESIALFNAWREQYKLVLRSASNTEASSGPK